MSTTTGIEWTDHTFNPWWGCTKVHAGCAHCYAETFAHRYGFNVWGQGGERRTFGDKHWGEPVKWNKLAEAEGRRHRVFCASMADVFEDHPALPDQRKRLFDLICRTPWLDWQVLTKRPENALPMMVDAGLYASENPDLPCPQPNLWIGTSPCDEATARACIPALLKVPAVLRFLSCEPLIGRVPLRDINGALNTWRTVGSIDAVNEGGIGWVIVGGESGPKARPCYTASIEEIIDDCRDACVPVFVKQLGAKPRECGGLKSWPLELKNRKGGDISEWPNHLRVRQFPEVKVPA